MAPRSPRRGPRPGPRPGHGLLRCPVCRLDLAGAAGRLVCRNRHSFDLARDGHVNLLVGRRRSLIARGDSAGQLDHRTAFLEAEHFNPVASAIARHVALAGAMPPAGRWRVLDAGCGTGHHLAGVAASLQAPAIGLGIDIAKPATERASRRWPDLAFAVADVWGDWPVRDAAADLVLSIFAPKNFAEMARVLRPGGWLAVVYPGPDHLAELIERFGLLRPHAHKAERYVEATTRLLGPAQAVRARHRVRLGPEDVRHAILMGPNARHLATVDVAAAMDVTIDIAMLFARKPG